MTKNKWALVTGASSGLGLEFVRQLAAQEHDLVLVGRNRGRLQAVAAEMEKNHFSTVEIICADLMSTQGITEVCARLENVERPIRVLINNAGSGIMKKFEASSAEDERAQLAIHVSAPLELSKAALPGMLARRDGRIVIVSSVAGYLFRGTYSSHKSWGLNFARSINAAYRQQGVHLSAVAPGFTRTEFHQRMGMDSSKVPNVLWLKPPEVVRAALKAVEAGRSVTIPTLRYKILVALSAVVPRGWHQKFFS